MCAMRTVTSILFLLTALIWTSEAFLLLNPSKVSKAIHSIRHTAPRTSNVCTLRCQTEVAIPQRAIPKPASSKGTVLIAGAGLSGLSTAKSLVDRGYIPVVLESRNVLGGKVAAWKDEDGDWYETGLHIFFGAYPNMMQLFEDLDIRDRLQWKQHNMIFAKAEQPGVFSKFEFPDIPGPFNGLYAIFKNNDMLSLTDKLLFGISLLPAIVFGQQYVEEMDSMSMSDWLKKRGAPAAVEREIFTAMAKALAFTDPDKLSATVVLTALNRFLQEGDGSKMAFLDGNPPERLCRPLVEYIEARGGRVLLNRPVERFLLDSDGSVAGFKVRGIRDPGSGEQQPTETWTADRYVSAMPVHILQKILPDPWRSGAHGPEVASFFNNMDPLEGVPVINVHLWFDRKLGRLGRAEADQLLFSRSKLLSVYADMSNTCREYADPNRSMLELVFAPAAAKFGGAFQDEFGAYEDWIGRPDEDIVAATMTELERLFPEHFGPAATDPARLRKSKVVKTPLSVYWSRPGMQKHRPSQRTPVRNFFLAGDFTFQRYLASMEGAVLSGKEAAEAIEAADQGRPAADQSSRLTIYRGDWPRLVRAVS